jgi:hypothetical protein
MNGAPMRGHLRACYARALDRFITEFESPGLHRPEALDVDVMRRTSNFLLKTCKWAFVGIVRCSVN